MSMTYQNAFDAIREANFLGSYGVAWRNGGWFLYNPTDGCPPDATPEFFCFRSGIVPLPLTEAAVQIVFELLGGAKP
jgi:hypothetical protein